MYVFHILYVGLEKEIITAGSIYYIQVFLYSSLLIYSTNLLIFIGEKPKIDYYKKLL